MYDIADVLRNEVQFATDYGDSDSDAKGAWLSKQTGYDGALIYLTNGIDIMRAYVDDDGTFVNEIIF